MKEPLRGKTGYAEIMALFLAGLIPLAGCAGGKQARYYTLHYISAEDRRLGPAEGVLVEVGPVSFPEYLKHSRVVTRVGVNELRLAELHEWAGLQEDFAATLQENLARLLGSMRIYKYPMEGKRQAGYRLIVDVIGFDGAPGGEASLNVRWLLRDGENDKAVAAGKSSYRALARGNDYADLVAAMSEALGTMSEAIAEEIRRASE